MRSQAARHVFRRLPAQASATLPPSFLLPRPVFRTYPVGCRVPRSLQRRTFFNLFKKPPRVLKAVEAEPGYETLLIYRSSEVNKTRPPPTSELVQAWRAFFGYKERYRRVVNSSQAYCAQKALEYLSENERSQEPQLSVEDLRSAMKSVARPPRDTVDDHLELSRLLYKEIRRKVMGIKSQPYSNISLEARIKNHNEPDYAKDLNFLLVALSEYGRAREAKDLLLEYFQSARGDAPQDFKLRQTWMPVIEGLAKEGREDDLCDLVSQAIGAGVAFDPAIHGVMTSFYARMNNMAKTKEWFEKSISKDLPPSPSTYYDVLQFALRNDRKGWAMDIYRNLVTKLDSGSLREHKACWDTSFQWAILLLEKGIDHIEHMLRVVQEKTQNNEKVQPNIGTINSLLRIAIDKDDPYLAERFISLSKKFGFSPNLKTFILQMEYRIRANDMDGAFKAYQSLQNLDETSKDAEISMLNRLIRALCSAPKPDYERVLDVTSYLESRHVTLEPETVVSICIAFLKNDETYEVIDTLSLHTVHYSIAERYMVRQAFVNYCLDKRLNSTARVWDAYTLLRQFFPEVENESRVAIMNAFFDRKRADMAAHVFGHMRASNNDEHRPTLATYVHFFEGLGRCPDEESLRMVHNMLKMDTTIQPNTLLYNSLMIAYTACDMPYRAIDIWKDVTATPEGPSYQTLELAFRAYQLTPYGDEPAKKLWEKMKMMDIDVPENVFEAYATMLAEHGHLEDVKNILDDADTVIGKRPELKSLAYVYNGLPNPEMKDEFESWAQHEHPATWEMLKKKHRKKYDENGLPVFKIKRPWKA
ncbi:pentatricopeptide repeat domain-containing protein [Xylariaceae sp. FL0016]|nr:pentatricopeptide repeat domain-containing protein [Xylariaceae sp. FL0016]